jgi:hypothetical protein
VRGKVESGSDKGINELIKTAEALKTLPEYRGRHVVLLGAGASKAAFPNGDANGLIVPVMNELVDAVGLDSLFNDLPNKIRSEKNFEKLYSQIVNYNSNIAEKIENKISKYFSNLKIGQKANLYDRILLSLRRKDAILTFNWDPFLMDAYKRNCRDFDLPQMFFLHGNVRIGMCLDDQKWGFRNNVCPECDKNYKDVPLLYPIGKKDYSKDPYIKTAWDEAKMLFEEAFTITIFGYGAPESDSDAIELLRKAWFENNDRKMEHIEIIDTADKSTLHERWSKFTPTLHYTCQEIFNHSRLARWPRRSCESIFYPMAYGLVCEDFPLPVTDCLGELQHYALQLAAHEKTSPRIRAGLWPDEVHRFFEGAQNVRASGPITASEVPNATYDPCRKRYRRS